MNFSYSDFEKIFKALTAAYHAKQPIELGEAWQVHWECSSTSIVKFQIFSEGASMHEWKHCWQKCLEILLSRMFNKSK